MSLLIVQNGFIFIAGQLPFIDGKLKTVGKIGQGVQCVQAQQARQLGRICALNALSGNRKCDWKSSSRHTCCQSWGFVASDSSFLDTHSVFDGAFDLFADIFGEKVSMRARQ